MTRSGGSVTPRRARFIETFFEQRLVVARLIVIDGLALNGLGKVIERVERAR
jgi:hypothetical protein